MGGASLFVLSALVVAPAFAADAPAADDTVVVVTGQRAQLKSAQKIKKDAPDIVDSVTAVDIGALPDRSVAEALQRVSGLTIQRAAEARDPIRMTAEAGDVEIRGLTWVRSETNGRDLFSAKNGRALSWGDVSADLLAGVDVHKNASADQIEGGIGGTVNLRTRMPFDSKGRVAAFTLDGTNGDLQKKNQYSASLLLSDRWSTSAGEIGVLLNYSKVNEGNETNVIGVDRYNAVTYGGGTKYVPNTMGWRTIDWRQERTATNLAIQWRPSDAVEISLTGFNAKAVPKSTEFNTGFYNDGGEFTSNASLATYSFDSNGVFRKGTVKSASITSNTRYGEDHNETSDISLHGRWTVSDRLTVAGDIQYIRSTSNVLSNTAFIQTDHTPDANIDITGDLPVLTIASPNVTGTKADYWWSAAMDHLERNKGTEIAKRLDGQYEIDNGWIKAFKFGIRTTDRTYETRQTNYNWGLLSNQYWGNGGGTPYWIDGTIHTRAGVTPAAPPAAITNNSGVPTNSNIPNLTQLRSFDNFMHGDVPVPGNIWFPTEALVANGTDYTYAQLHAVETSGWGWAPADLASYVANPNNGGLNQQREKTQSAYFLATFGGDVNWFGEGQTLDGNVGIRFVKTQETTSGYVVSTSDTNFGTTCATSSTVTAAMCTTYENARTFKSTNMTPVASGGTYENKFAIPSLNLRLKTSDQLQFRFAMSKGMVRPELAWLSPYTTLAFNQNTGAYTVNPTGNGGNPGLKPIDASQYDLTAEWYFNPGSSLTLDLFAKDLKNYIYSGTSVESYTNNGKTFAFNVTRYTNGTETGKVRGFELAYQQFYDFLPGPLSGLGFQGNYTHIDSSGGRNPIANIIDGNQVIGANLSGLPLEGMSPDSYNAAVMYEKYGISARLAYNWRSKYLYTTSAANVNRPMWSEAYGQLDGSIFYTLNTHYKVGMQVTNLGHATTRQLVSSDLTKPLVTQFYSAIQTDRRISVILRGTF